MADVFISYHKNSAYALALQVCAALEKEGIVCWYAPRDEKPGRPYMDSIIEAIEECKIFLLILNQGANQSRAVFREVHTAYENEDNGVIILPFWAERCELRKALRFILSPLQSVDSHCPPNEEDVRELVKQIALLLGKEPPKTQPVQPPTAKPQTHKPELQQPPVQSKPQPMPTLAAQPQPVQSPRKPTPQPQPAQSSANIIESGKCGDNVTYTLDSNGVLTISGVGAMWDYIYNEGKNINTTPWYLNRGVISCVRIQSGVTSIGTWAFADCNKLKNVTIPDTIIYIRLFAFYYCNSLTSIDIPDSVSSIEGYAFAHCHSLISISISKKTCIHDGTFPTITQIIRRP